VVLSDSVSQGIKEDRSGKTIVDRLKDFNIKNPEYKVIPDHPEKLTELVNRLIDQGCRLILTTGGTGLSEKDITPQTLQELFDTGVPGISEIIRSYGQKMTPYSMLSRTTAGIIRNCLVVALPGSVNAVRESMDAIFPHILHAFFAMDGKRHD